jgi:hypothetical protein
MDNRNEDNFVIVDLDTKETRGLINSMGGGEDDVAMPEAMVSEIKTMYFKLIAQKDDIITQICSSHHTNKRSPRPRISIDGTDSNH